MVWTDHASPARRVWKALVPGHLLSHGDGLAAGDRAAGAAPVAITRRAGSENGYAIIEFAR